MAYFLFDKHKNNFHFQNYLFHDFRENVFECGRKYVMKLFKFGWILLTSRKINSNFTIYECTVLFNTLGRYFKINDFVSVFMSNKWIGRIKPQFFRTGGFDRWPKTFNVLNVYMLLILYIFRIRSIEYVLLSDNTIVLFMTFLSFICIIKR